MTAQRKKPEIGVSMYFVQEHFYYVKGYAAPCLEYVVCKGKVTEIFALGYTEVCLIGKNPDGYDTPYRYPLKKIGESLFYKAKEAAAHAKTLTERYEQAWGWIGTPDIPMRRTWENLLLVTGDVDGGQMNIPEYQQDRDGITFGGCGRCICRNCLYWWSGRCPYGGCWDNHRAETDPYDKAHPGKPPRTAWSDWNKQGEQAHWCRGGVAYPVYHCPKFVKYQGQQVKECLNAMVSVYQDGYILCSLVETLGCEACYREFEARMED